MPLAAAAVRVKGKGTAMASLSDVPGDGLENLVMPIGASSPELSAGDEEAIPEG